VNKPAFLPTRLLDVGHLGDHSIRLILSKDLPKTKKNEYVTLSYCWGGSNGAACTTAENLVERMSAIPTPLLPKTLQDAIEITRAFGVRYLWIDALCIIQVKEGENEDWQRELSSMNKIYRHSLFTIAASSAKDSSVGLFHRREAARWPVHDYLLADDNRQIMLNATLPSWNTTVEISALAKRGWVLQERMLASRTLFWTEDGLFWDCREMSASEYETERARCNRNCPMLHELVESIERCKKHSGPTYMAWADVVEEFSQKALTMATDKLPAVTGLGNELSRLTGLAFIMGVWEHNLVQELAWVVEFSIPGEDIIINPQAARLPNTPSWTWASTNQKLSFKPGIYGYKYEELVTIVSVNAQQLQIRGRLGKLHVKKMKTKLALSNELVYHPTPCTFQPTRAEDDESDGKEIAVLDTLADTLPEEGGSIRCIQWIRWEDDIRYKVIGALVLSQVDEERGIYRRIGWLEVVGDEIFDEEYEVVTLI
jgi:hypothetical protein